MIFLHWVTIEKLPSFYEKTHRLDCGQEVTQRAQSQGVEEVSDSLGEWEPMIKQRHEELAWGEVLDPEKQLSILEPIV
jgi:hypothetical protein